MADKEITIKVSANADTQEVDDLKQTLEAMENTNITIEIDNSNVEQTITDAEELQTAFEEATNRVDELTQELANIEMGESEAEFEEVAQQLEEAEQQAEALSEALANLDTTGLTGANDSANELADGLGNAKTNMDELNDSMGLIESTMLMDMANQIGALGDQAEGMAQEMNTASITVGQLSTNVGMAEPQMVSLINHISNATFPQNEAMAYVQALNQMGVSADKLGDSATNMDRINDATGMGYQKVMQLTQGLQAVGVSADNLPSSFNALAYAQANVNGGAETLGTVLKRQASTINEYGLNVDQLVIIMQSLSEKGVQGMKMGSELSKVLKDNNGDIQAIEQSLGLEAGALSNASAKTGQYTGKLQQLANEEAEHKTFIDQINAGWEDMQLALSPVLNPLMSFVGLIGQFGQLALATNSIITLCETFGLLKVTEEGVTIAQWTLNASMLANPALWLVIAIVALIGILIYLYYTNEDVRNAIDGLGQAFIQAGQIIYTTVINFVNWVIEQLQNLWQYISTVGGLIEGGVKITGNNVIDGILAVMIFLATLPAQIGMIFLNIIAKALGFGDNFTQNMIKGAVDSVNGFIQWIQTLPDRLGEEFNHMLQMAEQFALDIADRLTFGGASMVVGWITGSGEHSPGFMYDALLGELSAMVGLPLEVLSGLIENIFGVGYEMANALTESLMGVSLDEAVEGIINTIMGLAQQYKGFSDYVLSIGGLLDTSISITGNKVIDTGLRILGFIATLPIQVGIYLLNMVAQALGFGSNFSQNMLNAGISAVNNFISQIATLPNKVWQEFNEIINNALNFAGRIGQILWDAGVNAISNFLNALDRHSPGIMQREFVAEITEMGDRVPNVSRNLIKNMGELGEDIVSSFGNPQFNIGSNRFNNSNFANQEISDITGILTDGNSAQINNFYFTDTVVDNDDRMRKIYEYITRELHWDNKTAGRSKTL